LRLVTDREVRWPARVTRIANRIDPVTRTVQVVLSVAEPYRSAAPPQRPPLVAGMYVEGVLSVASSVPRVVIPSAALHHDEIYLADASGRLLRRTVAAQLQQRDFVVIGSGVAAGERVVIDELMPAIGGMALELHHDIDAQARLQRAAMGEPR
jgi:multidrug efflux pump subunit AcrA (membrane-fusion protein)